jgi:integrase
LDDHVPERVPVWEGRYTASDGRRHSVYGRTHAEARDQLRAALTGKETTVRYAYSVLRIALGRALKQGKVIRNVATLIDPPRKARYEVQPLDAQQVREFLASVAEDRLGPLFTLAVATGMRQGELLALRWEDVDLEAGSLSVRHTLQVGTRELAETKTERSRRRLPLAPPAIAALRRQRDAQKREGIVSGYVFTSSRGTPLDARNVIRDLHAALERAGLPHQRFHDLRHAYATLMLQDGEDLAVISKSLGHATIRTTADTYAHLTDAMSKRAAQRMGAILSGTA